MRSPVFPLSLMSGLQLKEVFTFYYSSETAQSWWMYNTDLRVSKLLGEVVWKLLFI